MSLQIECLADRTTGQLSVSGEVPPAAWNRICDAVLGVEPSAVVAASHIQASWSTVLAVARSLAWVRDRYRLVVTYDDAARQGLARFKEETRAIASATVQRPSATSQEELHATLRNRGFTRRVLTPEQSCNVARLAALRNGADFSVPGAGKTSVALALHILIRDTHGHLLVVAPRNAFGAWDDAVTDCMAPDLADEWRFTRLTGGRDAIRGQLAASPLRAMISYDQLVRVDDLIAAFLVAHRVHLVLDESHRMKAGGGTLRGTSVLRLAHLASRRDILSGTPIPNSIDDIAPQMDFLWPGQGIGRRAASSEDPGLLLRPLYVRTTKRELGLPGVQREFIPVPMSGPQMALYAVVRDEAIKRLSGIRQGANVDLRAARRSVMRLLQVSSNPVLLVRRLTAGQPDDYPYNDSTVQGIFTAVAEELDSPKIEEACRLARSLALTGEKSVIWSTFPENVERIAALLSDLGATYIHGGVSTGEADDVTTREARIRLFHLDQACMVLVVSTGACSEGMSLHRVCHNAIYLDRSFNAAHYLQSVDRIHRLGLPPDAVTRITVLESIAPGQLGSVDYSVRRRLADKLTIMSVALDEADLRQLALDEEEPDEPLDLGITREDMLDVINELTGRVSGSHRLPASALG